MTQTLSLDPRTTALVMIDLQQGIVGRPLAPHSGADVVANAKLVADAMRSKGATVVFVRVALNELLNLPADTPMRKPDAPSVPPAACELVAEVGLQESDLIVSKRQWGAFYGTDLDQQLRRRCIETIVIGGVATNFGVESTARAAFDRGYRLVFVEDATSSVSEEMHHFTFEKLFRHMGNIRSTEEVIAALT